MTEPAVWPIPGLPFERSGGAAFTMRLKRVIELTGGVVDTELVTFKGASMGALSVMTGGNIGLTHYPLFDETYRSVLNGKIIDHFYLREIGVEHISTFQLFMRRKMNEIMPLYNKLYLTEQKTFDPLLTVDITTEAEASSTDQTDALSVTHTTSDALSKSRVVNSTTPQTMLSGNEDYATAAADSNSDSLSASDANSDTNQTATGENESTSHTHGYQGIPSDLIMAWRNSLINIDLMILTELEVNFMQVFDSPDEYAQYAHQGWY